MRRGAVLFVCLGLVMFFPATAVAATGAPAYWPAWNLLAGFLALLAPVALVLVAAAGSPPEEAGELVATALGALAVGLAAYVACGFAFAFGGVALQVNWPGLAGLGAEWSPLDPGTGAGWGVIGLRGFLLGGPAVTPDAYALAAVRMPAVALAVLVPVLALARRTSRRVLMALAALVGGLVHPLAGNWVWGGGWLALLGANAGWGHGFVDLGGSATVHALGAATALIGILVFGRSRPTRAAEEVVELPSAHFPLFALVGALLAPAGWVAMVLANPLVTPDLAPGLVAVTLVLAAAGGAAPGLAYSWFVTGRADPQLAARGLVAGLVAGSASCGFVPPGAALLAGFLAGGTLPLVHYAVEHRLRWQDPNAVLATHGVPGILGTLWVALFADGRWGVGWNGVPSPMGLAQQGVAGLVVAPGRASDIPGQLWAQLAGLGAILVLAICVAALLFGLAVAGRA
ncbi:MAG: hypothetical protein QME94_13365, partial [Anaerolineae bacterium]|nr:hypothetical protein [Anaerolineae bacterium]